MKKFYIITAVIKGKMEKSPFINCESTVRFWSYKFPSKELMYQKKWPEEGKCRINADMEITGISSMTEEEFQEFYGDQAAPESRAECKKEDLTDEDKIKWLLSQTGFDKIELEIVPTGYASGAFSVSGKVKGGISAPVKGNSVEEVLRGLYNVHMNIREEFEEE